MRCLRAGRCPAAAALGLAVALLGSPRWAAAQGACKAVCVVSQDGATRELDANGQPVTLCLLPTALPEWSNQVNDDETRMAAYVGACVSAGWGPAGCGAPASSSCSSASAVGGCVALPDGVGCNPTLGIAQRTGWTSFVTLQENGAGVSFLFGAEGNSQPGTYRPVCASNASATADNAQECAPTCEPGTFSATGAPPCTTCSAGRYADMAAVECENCADGTADTDLNPSTECDTCSPGMYSRQLVSAPCTLATTVQATDWASLTTALGCSNSGLLCGATDRCVDLRGATSPLIADGPLMFDTTTVKILSTAGRIAIRGNSTSRVFVVTGSASLELENLELTEGYDPTVTPRTPLRLKKPLPCADLLNLTLRLFGHRWEAAPTSTTRASSR